MQSKIIQYFVVGLLAVTFAGAGLVTNTQAQWVPTGSPYRAAVYPLGQVYPAYVVWRPFGGLFAGLHAGLHGLLCPQCHLSPCCCVDPCFVPLTCAPCWTPCLAPCFTSCCDPCCDSCCTTCGVADCGCTPGFAFYEQPISKTIGVLSATGFGSVTPAGGIPGQRPVGVPTVQSQEITSGPKPPPTGTLRSTISSGSSRPTNDTFSNPTNGPTVAPPQNGAATMTSEENIESRLQEIRRNREAAFANTPQGGTINSGAADIPPTTGSTGFDSFPNPASTNDGIRTNTPETAPAQPGGAYTTPGGELQYPVGAPGTDGGSTQNRMIDLGTGLISVTVPEHSKVYINGYETKMLGVNRNFVVNDLEPGMRYDYNIRIVAQINGQTVEESHRVTLSSGQQDALVFGRPRPQFDDNSSRSYVAARPVQ